MRLGFIYLFGITTGLDLARGLITHTWPTPTEFIFIGADILMTFYFMNKFLKGA